MKSVKKTSVSNQFVFQKDQIVTFLMPSVGKKKAKVLGTMFTALSGYTVTLIVENHGLMDINEIFLQRLIERAV